MRLSDNSTQKCKMVKKENIKQPTLEKRITIRFSDAEYAKLYGKAEKEKRSLSNVVKYLLFNRESDNDSNKQHRNQKNLLQQNTSEIRKKFKEISLYISQQIKTYKTSLSEKNSQGEPAINTTQTIRYFDATNMALQMLTDAVNSMLKACGEEGVRDGSARQAKPVIDNAIAVNSSAPIKAAIYGRISSVVKDYESGGVLRSCFNVTFQTYRYEKKWVYTVLFDMKKTSEMNRIVKGRDVTGIGGLHIELLTQDGSPKLRIILDVEELKFGHIN